MAEEKNQNTNKNPNPKELENVVGESTEIDDDFLKDELEELQKAEDNAKEAKADFAPLLNKIKELESQLQEKDEIAKNSQINYLHLKADFDILQRQTQQKVDNAERDAEIKVVKELLPFVENLRKSLLNLTEEQQTSSL
jgi:molecular chaperone GrpE (heat shock protein)